MNIIDSAFNVNDASRLKIDGGWSGQQPGLLMRQECPAVKGSGPVRTEIGDSPDKAHPDHRCSGRRNVARGHRPCLCQLHRYGSQHSDVLPLKPKDPGGKRTTEARLVTDSPDGVTLFGLGCDGSDVNPVHTSTFSSVSCVPAVSLKGKTSYVEPGIKGVDAKLNMNIGALLVTVKQHT